MENLTARIVIDALEKRYETRGDSAVLALDGVTTQLGESEFVSVVGPSGCGKTTLLKIVAGLVEPTEGAVDIRGHTSGEASEDSHRRGAKIGMVFQSPVLLPWLDVLENVLLPLRVLKRLSRRTRAEHERRAADLFALVDLQDVQHKFPNELSGGMQQRVALCRALIHDPPVLLMDEPFGALDALTRDTLNIELQNLWIETRKTILFITHSIPEAVFLSDRVLVLSRRPGVILDDISIPLERPRTMDATMSSVEFGDLTARIRSLIGLESRNAEEAR